MKTESVRLLGRTNPVVRRGLRRARLVLAQNDESASRLRSLAPEIIVRPNASVDVAALLAARNAAGQAREQTAVVAGRLLPLKGVSLAIRAIALLPDWKLEVIGAGPEERRLRRLAGALGIAERVTFIPWLAQQILWQRMAESSAVLVPSIRDAASMILAEATSLGIPVVALDQGGPRVLARMTPGSVQLVPHTSGNSTVSELARALTALPGTHTPASLAFSVDSVAADLNVIYARAVGTTSGTFHLAGSYVSTVAG